MAYLSVAQNDGDCGVNLCICVVLKTSLTHEQQSRYLKTDPIICVVDGIRFEVMYMG